MSNDVKNVVVFGCGLVSPPMLEYLSGRGYSLQVAVREEDMKVAQDIVKTMKNVELISLDVSKAEDMPLLNQLIGSADVVVSLLPYVFHYIVMEACVAHSKDFVAPSYVSDNIMVFNEKAKEAKIFALMECGVDPGMDISSAQKILDDVHANNGKVISFKSICGGLPAPEDNDSPFDYKFSWSPRGVFLASANAAYVLINGEKVEISNIFDPAYVESDMVDGIALESYCNRNAIMYIDIHCIPEVKTIVRGTYRYLGWARLIRALKGLNVFSLDKISCGGMTIDAFLRQHFHIAEEENLRTAVGNKITLVSDSEKEEMLEKLDAICFFSTDVIIPESVDTALDVLCFLTLRAPSFTYQGGQRDVIIMRHTFEVEYTSADRRTLQSTLFTYGDQDKNGYSAMARTVSLPVALVTEGILLGKFEGIYGVHRPIDPRIYNVMNDGMSQLGVDFKHEELGQLIWLRAETKPGERRTPLTPAAVQMLIEQGFRVSVERSETRCFLDAEYEQVGAKIVEFGSWSKAPHSAIIFGLKELPENDDSPLTHRHIFFAHCYKNQGGWKDILSRFVKGGGLLWDLEFLVDEKGRRVAAFGRPAGIGGMAVALLAWAAQMRNEGPLGALKPWNSMSDAIQQVRQALDACPRKPTILVIGALGRVGGGAVWFAKQCGIEEPVEWDLAETKNGGPFPQLLEHDILVNSIYLKEEIPHFLTEDMLNSSDRALSVICDVSCDVGNPANPLPFLHRLTTLEAPTLRIRDSVPLDIITIDHLPTLVPRESSSDYCEALLHHIFDLKNPTEMPVWKRAEDTFYEKCALLSA